MASTINASNTGFGGIVQTGDSTGQLQLQTAGTTAVTIDTSQNVGIGTTSPTYKVDVVGQYAFQGTGYQPFITLKDTNASNQSIRIISASANTLFFNDNVGSGSYTERMRIDSSGNVGIGTTSPGQRLNVSDGTVTLLVHPSGSGSIGYMGTYTNHPLAITTNNAERMRIDASGNLQVGTTTSLGKVTFTGASSSDLLALNTTATSGSATAIVYKDGALDVCGYVSMNTTANTVTYVNSSDSRLKTNPRDFSGIDIVKEIKPKKYERLSNLGVDEIGLYAQELNEVFPEAVAVGDEDVTVKPWGIDYGRITPVLVKAIQEQQAIIEDLKARIETLENK